MSYREYVGEAIRNVLDPICDRHGVRWGKRGETIAYGKRRIIIYELAKALKETKIKYKDIAWETNASIGEIHTIVKMANKDYDKFIALNENRKGVRDLGRTEAQKRATEALKNHPRSRTRFYQQKPACQKKEPPAVQLFGLPEALQVIGTRVYVRADGELRLDAKPATAAEVIEVARRMNDLVQRQRAARMVSAG
jgi:hypothetical protein